MSYLDTTAADAIRHIRAEDRKCPPCRKGDCRHHRYDYTDQNSQIWICRCPNHEPSRA